MTSRASMYWFSGGKKKNFWSSLYQRNVVSNAGMASRCIAFWLLADAVYDKDPKRICAAFGEVDRTFEKTKLSRKYTIALIEAAVWHSEQRIADKVLKYVQTGRSALGEGPTLARLMALYAWRFSKKVYEAIPLVSPLTPHDAVLPFVDYYARASVAESLQKYDEALRFYRMALNTIPYDYDERRRAEERCNSILRKLNVP